MRKVENTHGVNEPPAAINHNFRKEFGVLILNHVGMNIALEAKNHVPHSELENLVCKHAMESLDLFQGDIGDATLEELVEYEDEAYEIAKAFYLGDEPVEGL